MASEQIEYCGECKHYEQCMSRAKEGRLTKCILNEKEER